ncbi:MAG: Ldh family oxidoreductase [Rhizobiaceae bacterium]
MIAPGKLILSEERVVVPVHEARVAGITILKKAGCSEDDCREIVEHLLDADLSGVESHGIMRVLQYHDEFQRGYLMANAVPQISNTGPSTLFVDGGGGLGIPAMRVATQSGISAAHEKGLVAIAVRNTGHTGRLGAFAEMAASAGILFIACGGGARDRWRMVAPHGGSKAILPTNPWCMGIPGGDDGPVVIDCATSQIAGGWIYAARRAGAELPKGCIVDRNGNATQDPEDYFAGGAILPKGGVLGYGLATMGELICDAMLGPATVESNTFILMVDTSCYREAGVFQVAAEEILTDLRTCPPAEGFEKVEIPGERERNRKAGSENVLLPERTWEMLRSAASM